MSDKTKQYPPSPTASPRASVQPVISGGLKTKTVSNAKIVVPRIKKEKMPVKGGDIFPVPYRNIFLCAMTGSGKTTIVSNIMEKCAGANTKFIIIGNTVELDPTWIATIKKFKKRGHHVTALIDIIDPDTGGNEIQEFMDKNKHMIEKKHTEGSDDEDQSEYSDDEDYEEPKPQPQPKPQTPQIPQAMQPLPMIRQTNGFPVRQRQLAQFQTLNQQVSQPAEPTTRNVSSVSEPEEKPKRKRKPSKIYPEYIMVLDDLGDTLKNRAVGNFMRQSRHYKTLVIASSQHLNDLSPAALGQLGYCLIFANFSDEKLLELHGKLRIPLKFDRFKQLYDDATKNKFGFLYINRTGTVEFRKGFTERYII